MKSMDYNNIKECKIRVYCLAQKKLVRKGSLDKAIMIRRIDLDKVLNNKVYGILWPEHRIEKAVRYIEKEWHNLELPLCKEEEKIKSMVEKVVEEYLEKRKGVKEIVLEITKWKDPCDTVLAMNVLATNDEFLKEYYDLLITDNEIEGVFLDAYGKYYIHMVWKVETWVRAIRSKLRLTFSKSKLIYLYAIAVCKIRDRKRRLFGAGSR